MIIRKKRNEPWESLVAYNNMVNDEELSINTLRARYRRLQEKHPWITRYIGQPKMGPKIVMVGLEEGGEPTAEENLRQNVLKGKQRETIRRSDMPTSQSRFG